MLARVCVINSEHQPELLQHQLKRGNPSRNANTHVIDLKIELGPYKPRVAGILFDL